MALNVYKRIPFCEHFTLSHAVMTSSESGLICMYNLYPHTFKAILN